MCSFFCLKNRNFLSKISQFLEGIKNIAYRDEKARTRRNRWIERDKMCADFMSNVCQFSLEKGDNFNAKKAIAYRAQKPRPYRNRWTLREKNVPIFLWFCAEFRWKADTTFNA